MRPLQITSAANPLIRQVIAVKDKPGSSREGAFLVEGPHLIETALRSGAHIERILFTAGFGRKHEWQKLIRRLLKEISPASAGSPEGTVIEVSEQVFTRLSDTETPQGILAVIALPTATLDGLQFRATPLLAVCDGIQDPGNLGTIVRAADAAGADAVVIMPGTCSPYNSKAVRATAGSLFNIPVVRSDAEDLIRFLMRMDMRLLATDIRGTVSLYDTDLALPIALAFGNEAHGVSRELRKAADQLIRIPIFGKAESLNVAMSASVCLYETARQRMKRI